MSDLASERTMARVLRCLARMLQAVALAVAIATPGIALANPTGASVAHGSAAFATPDAATLNITTSNGAIINWQQFGINPGEVTRFLQQGGSAAVLNRVVGGDPSAILGSLLSNGRVFLLNPNGVVFGPNAVVDTAGLVVSTLNMSDDDFINGRLHFQGDGSSGAVVNQGQIRAQGSIILIAPRIENSGLIETAGGGLLLAAGREVTITSFENPEIAYLLEAPENEVVNLGQLITNGGAASVFAGSIRHSGEINASSVIVGKDGRVQLVASADVTLESGSIINADGANGGEIVLHARAGSVALEDATLSATGEVSNGGDIHVLGNEVEVLGTTTIDASGRDGGGEVLVGGDYQGANTDIANAENTRLGADARLIADATGSGDGGKIIVWSDGTTQSAGEISARGGPLGGNGGLVEVSGKQALGFSSHVNTLAPHGTPGLLLLDPLNIIAAQIPAINSAGLGDVDEATDPSGGVTGCDGTTCTIDTDAINAALSPVLLQATNDITIANAINIAAAGVSFTAQANNDIFVNASVTTNNAAIMLQANQANGGVPASDTGSVVINNALNSGGGAVSVQAGGNIDLSGGSINAGNGAVDLLITGGTGAADILLGDIATTGDVAVINQNLFAGSDILQPGLTAITGTRVLLEIENTPGPATAGTYTIGAASNPIRIGDGVKLEAHGHVQTVPIFIQGLGDLTIGDGGAALIKGINSPGGDIEINAAVTLTLLAPSGPLQGPVQNSGNGTDKITLTAGNGIVVNAAINADTGPVDLDAGGGAIVQGANGIITAGVLNIINTNSADLRLPINNVIGLSGSGIIGAGLLIRNDSGGSALALNNITSNGAPIVIDNAGGTSITGIVDAGADNASITESTRDISGGGGRVQGNSVTLYASSGGIGNGTVVITDTASTLNLSSGGSGAAGNIDVEEVDAISTSSVNITTDSLSMQSVKFVTGAGNLTIDNDFGDSGDNYDIRAEAASLLITADSVDANNLTLRGANAITLTGTTLNAGTAFSANAAEIDVYSSTINGSTLSLTSSGTTHVSAGGGGAASLVATDSVIINASNDILVQAGSVAGANAEIAADNFVSLSAGRNIDIIGSAESAVIKSSLGNVALSALGAVTLTAGAGSNADAVIAANSGSGTVDITSSSCVNCVLLGFDPFANASADQGIFAAALNLMSTPVAVAAAAAAVGTAQDDSVDTSDRDVLVFEDFVERLAAERLSEGDDDEDEQKICR